MCGIVGAVAERNITPILLEGLKRLEYRGYDSAGIAVIDSDGQLMRLRRSGKVAELEQAQQQEPLAGRIGIAHTRWATHGAPCERNAHPHFSSNEIAVVHNGIIENHQALREQLKGLGYLFTSDTDTEVIVHLLHYKLHEMGDLAAASRPPCRNCMAPMAWRWSPPASRTVSSPHAAAARWWWAWAWARTSWPPTSWPCAR